MDRQHSEIIKLLVEMLRVRKDPAFGDSELCCPGQNSAARVHVVVRKRVQQLSDEENVISRPCFVRGSMRSVVALAQIGLPYRVCTDVRHFGISAALTSESQRQSNEERKGRRGTNTVGQVRSTACPRAGFAGPPEPFAPQSCG